MEFSNEEDHDNVSLIKFELMLKTNKVLFFDSNEFENIIHHYLEIGRINIAKKALKMGLAQHPYATHLKLLQVELYVLEDKLVHADELLDSLYDLEPSNEEIYIQKASILSKKNEHQKAINTLKIALDLTSEEDHTIDLYALIGMEHLFLDQYEEAKNYFIKCLRLDPEDYASLYNIIYCFDLLELTEEAIEFLTEYLDASPYSEVAWHQLGKEYSTLKKYEQALDAYDYAIISDDTFIGAYIEKGKVLEKLHKYSEAIENYEATLSLDDPSSYVLLRIGSCYEHLENYDLALEYYFKTVHEDPQLDKGWIAITKFYKKLNNYQKALYYINKALSIDHDKIQYWKLYAQINHRLDFFEEAERGYKRALDLGDYAISTWLERGDLLIHLGELEAAALNFIQAAEFHPEAVELDYRLSGIYFSLLEPEKGHYHLKNALLLNSKKSYIIDELFPQLMKKDFISDIILKSRNRVL